MLDAANWIEDRNKFKLPQPPQWVLDKLWNFDHQLVLIPSRKEKTYLLARRRQYSAGLGDVALMENKHPDTNMCYAHGVVPIAPLVFKNGIKWEQKDVEGLIAQLKARDTWALTGGPDKDPDAAWKAVEAAEAAEQKRKRKSLWDDFHHRGRDAWRSIKARTGQRSKRASDYHGVARSVKQ